MSPVPEPGGASLATAGSQAPSKRHNDEWHIVSLWPRGMVGRGNVSKGLVLRIVSEAGLEPPFGPSAKMAMPGRSVSFDGEPTHL
ncbi:MAG: hypothetical protein ABW168_20065 [Sedimenticola sp.]